MNFLVSWLWSSGSAFLNVTSVSADTVIIASQIAVIALSWHIIRDVVNTFLANGHFLFPLKTPENL